MRIISGLARGRRLKTLPGLATRPTADRVKEALFNVLGSRCAGTRVLDLYAGSGALGLESLSRGAREAVFVDQSPTACAVIAENIRRTGLGPGVVRRQTVYRYLIQAARAGETFDIIFLDPPYEQGMIGQTLKQLEAAAILSQEGLVVAERSRREPLPPLEALLTVREDAYGDTVLSYLRPASRQQGGIQVEGSPVSRQL